MARAVTPTCRPIGSKVCALSHPSCVTQPWYGVKNFFVEDDSRPWIQVTRPVNPRDALTTALASLDRPPVPRTGPAFTMWP
jgi:hypothetical protein